MKNKFMKRRYQVSLLLKRKDSIAVIKVTVKFTEQTQYSVLFHLFMDMNCGFIYCAHILRLPINYILKMVLSVTLLNALNTLYFD